MTDPIKMFYDRSHEIDSTNVLDCVSCTQPSDVFLAYTTRKLLIAKCTLET